MLHPGKETKHQILSKQILIVEDSHLIQKAWCFLFEPFELTIDMVSSGEQAVSVFEPGKYAMVLLDIGLPDIDGYEVCKRLLALEEGSDFHVPIIGISAHVTPEKQEAALQAGMEEMLSKPLGAEEIKALLQRYIL